MIGFFFTTFLPVTTADVAFGAATGLTATAVLATAAAGRVTLAPRVARPAEDRIGAALETVAPRNAVPLEEAIDSEGPGTFVPRVGTLPSPGRTGL